MGEGSGGKFAHDALELSVQFSLGLYSNWGAIAPVFKLRRVDRAPPRVDRATLPSTKKNRVSFISEGGGGLIEMAPPLGYTPQRGEGPIGRTPPPRMGGRV